MIKLRNIKKNNFCRNSNLSLIFNPLNKVYISTLSKLFPTEFAICTLSVFEKELLKIISLLIYIARSRIPMTRSFLEHERIAAVHDEGSARFTKQHRVPLRRLKCH